MKSRFRFSIIISSLLIISGCTKSPDDSSSSSDSFNSNIDASAARVRCGVFTDDEFQSDVPFNSAEPVKVRALSSDLVIITRTTGEDINTKQLVKLQGITTSGLSSGKISRGVDLIEQNASFDALFLAAGEGCSVTVNGGGQGVFGHLFTSDLKSINEMLLEKGLALPETGICGGDSLAGCYAGIEVQEEISDQVIDHVLWKPVSDSDGKLVVLSSAFDVNVSVEGSISSMAGKRIGPGNGFGESSRFPYAGCAYGSNIKLTFTDLQDRIVPLANGETSVAIPNGCQRTELRF
ncbi:MAG: hypothetical protein SGJ02_13325 [bacterium]|nr:hypothetical protein [bacterium]